MAKNKIRMKAHVSGRRISYEYDVAGPWGEAFNLESIDGWFADMSGGIHQFFVEYDESMSGVPESIAIIPFLCNVLPIAWLYDAEVILPELDLEFFESIPGFKRGYIGMYPGLQFGGQITAAKLVNNSISCKTDSPLSLFDCGIDDSFVVLSRLKDKPWLASIWGSDIYFTQQGRWCEHAGRVRDFAKSMGLRSSFIKSSFRFFLNYKILNEKFAKKGKASGWWHGFQHGIGQLGHLAPLAWKHGIPVILVPSAYSIKDDASTTSASWPTIENFVRLPGTLVEHFGFNHTRSEKLAAICSITAKTNVVIDLKICARSVHSGNCSRCEMCVRTMFQLIALGSNPVNFGFKTDADTMEAIRNQILKGELKPNWTWVKTAEKLVTMPGWISSMPAVRAFVEAVEKLK